MSCTQEKTFSVSKQLLVLLAMLTALDAMAIDMYLPGMPAIAEGLGTNSAKIQQTLAVFLAGLAVGQALYGPLLDRYGRRLPLLAGMILFVAGSVFATAAGSVENLMIARFIQALGAAAGLVSPRALINDVCNTSESAKIYSLLMQVMMIAPVMAPILGSFVLIFIGWRGIFGVLSLLGIIGFCWCLLSLPETLPENKRTPLVFMDVYRAYMKKLSDKIFMAYTIAGGIVFGSLFNYISGSAFIFTNYYGLNPGEFSCLFAFNSIMLILGGWLSNHLMMKGYSSRIICTWGLIAHSLSGGILLVIVHFDMATFLVYALILSFSIGSLGLVFGNMTALTMENAGGSAGVASALMGAIQYLLSAGVGYIISSIVQGPLSLPFGIVACGILALLICMAVPAKK